MTTPTLDDIRDFDLRRLPDSFYLDPYPMLHALRRTAPLHRCPDGSWLLTRHADLNHVYRNPRLFSSDKQQQFRPMFGDGPLFEHHTTSLVFNDPPLHTQVRKAIGDALSPRVVTAMQASLVRLVDELLDAMAARVECDLMQDFAAAIPIEVIGNLLALRREDRQPLQRWSNAILGALEFGSDPARLAEGNEAVEQFVAFLKDLIAERRRDAASADDIVSRLIRWESADFRLSEFQIYHQCIFLLNAGHETTTNLIGNGVLALLKHPAQLQRLRDDQRLIDATVEECLRYEAPVQLGNRTVTAATRIDDVELEAGTVLTLAIGAANRDPAVFAEPDAFDITRNPNPHLSFGAGIHTCAGLAVARLEARIALSRLFERFPRLALAGEPQRARRARFRALERLPVTCL
ncbi:MAG: cytochrome P450 [Gammaproteobacteria bacterium]|nr:cytochrome P450 [Gammaproteobacteria bacterium]